MSEYVQFAEAMTLFVALLVGSYFFVLTSPSARGNESRSGREHVGLRVRFRNGGK